MFFALIIFFIIGLSFGSLINVIVPRLHSGEGGMGFGRSRCPHCKTTLTPRDLIPLLSYLFLNGHCRHCKKSIHWHYPVIELVTGIAFILLFLRYRDTVPTYETVAQTTLVLLYALVLITVALYDLQYGEIPDRVMLPAIFVALVVSPLHFTPFIVDSLIGALIPLGFFGILIALSKGKWMGGGDLRLGAFMGLLLGWQLTLAALVFAYVSGSIVSIALLSTGIKKRTDTVPFGPFLVLGTLFAILWGDAAVDWYLALLGRA